MKKINRPRHVATCIKNTKLRQFVLLFNLKRAKNNWFCYLERANVCLKLME